MIFGYYPESNPVWCKVNLTVTLILVAAIFMTSFFQMLRRSFMLAIELRLQHKSAVGDFISSCSFVDIGLIM